MTTKQTAPKRDDIPKVSFEQAMLQLTISWNIRRPLLIVGPPATAKSAVAKAFAEANDFDIIVTTAATAHPVDPKGQPATGTREDGTVWADFIPYGDLAQAVNATRPTLWVFDDLTNADADVQKSFMQLFNERQVNNHKLSDLVHIVATGNRREDKSGVKSLIEAMKTRFGQVIEIVPDLDNYLSGYAIPNDFHPGVIGFLRFMPDKLYVSNPTADMNREPNLRMWEALSLALHELDDMGVDVDARRLTVSAICGVGLASDVNAYLDMRAELPDPQGCIDDPQGCQLPDASSIGALFALNAAIARLTTVHNFPRIVEIADRLPTIAAAKLIFDAKAYCPEAEQTGAYADWCARNAHRF